MTIFELFVFNMHQVAVICFPISSKNLVKVQQWRTLKSNDCKMNTAVSKEGNGTPNPMDGPREAEKINLNRAGLEILSMPGAQPGRCRSASASLPPSQEEERP